MCAIITLITFLHNSCMTCKGALKQTNGQFLHLRIKIAIFSYDYQKGNLFQWIFNVLLNMIHLLQPIHSKVLTRLAFLPDYKRSQIICLAFLFFQKVPKLDFQGEFARSFEWMGRRRCRFQHQSLYVTVPSLALKYYFLL